MIWITFLVVVIYSWLMVYILAKLGSVPAQSVISIVRGNNQPSSTENKQKYEHTISTR